MKLSSWEKNAIESIFRFTSLQCHENELTGSSSGRDNNKSMYNVKFWLSYLDDIDSLLSGRTEKLQKLKQKQQQTQKGGSSSSRIREINAIKDDETIVRLREVRDFIGRRSVAALPGSYKLWRNQWEFLTSPKNYDSSPSETKRIIILETFECALRTLHKYPRVWIEYFTFVWKHYENQDRIPVYTNNNKNSNKNNHSNNNVNADITIARKATKITFLRTLANRALQALPVTQHDKVWPVIIEYCKESIIHLSSNDETRSNRNNEESLLIWETCSRLLRRYVQLEPSYLPTLAQLYIQQEQWGEAALIYQQILQKYNTTNFAKVPKTAITTKHEQDGDNNEQKEDDDDEEQLPAEYDSWWNILADVCCKHPIEVENAGVPWETILRAVLNSSSSSSSSSLNNDIIDATNRENNNDSTNIFSTFTSHNKRLEEMKGLLWSKLADSYIRRGEFDLARSIYEEALEKVSTVRDFTILFDAYLKLEEGLLEAKTKQMMEMEEDEENVEKLEGTEQNQNKSKDDDDDDDDDEDWDILLDINGNNDENENENNTSDDNSNNNNKQIILNDMEFALARAEYLTARRPLLLNRVLLRQNPYDISEWINRSQLYVQQSSYEMAASSLQEALETISITYHRNNRKRSRNQKPMNGSISKVLQRLVDLYANPKYLNNKFKAKELLRDICYNNNEDNNSQNYFYEFYHDLNDYAECWAIYVDFEIKKENYDHALSLIRQAVLYTGSRNKKNNGRRYTYHLNKSLRLWDILLDLEEGLGTTQTTKDAYYNAIETKIITPIQILNFISFLKDHKYFEESFTIYERGVELFAFPHHPHPANLLWKSYIRDFLLRYFNYDIHDTTNNTNSSSSSKNGKDEKINNKNKIERVRDLFTRCLEFCPSDYCTDFYILYGEFEEEHGLLSRALKVYDTMCQRVPIHHKLMSYQLYIIKMTQYRGLTSTRDVYQKAIESFNVSTANENKKEHQNIYEKNKIILQLCMEFSNMETLLNEIDRSRKILQYGSQLADPKMMPEYWKNWNEFEILYGNEETFRDMLRIKRSVIAAFSTVNYNNTSTSTTNNKSKSNDYDYSNNNNNTLSNEEAMKMIADREGVSFDVESQQPQTIGGFVPASTNNNNNKRVIATVSNLDEVEERVAKLRKATATSATTNTTNANNEEIDIDDIDDDDDGEEDYNNHDNTGDDDASTNDDNGNDNNEINRGDDSDNDNNEINLDDEDNDDNDDENSRNKDDEVTKKDGNDTKNSIVTKSPASTTGGFIKNVVTKTVPVAVFGGLLSERKE